LSIVLLYVFGNIGALIIDIKRISSGCMITDDVIRVIFSNYKMKNGGC
jgi:hypothetical protein